MLTCASFHFGFQLGKRWDLIDRQGTAAEDDGLDAVGRLAESILARSVSCYNKHVVLPKFSDAGIKKPHGFAVAKMAREKKEALTDAHSGESIRQLVVERLPFINCIGSKNISALERSLCKFEGVSSSTRFSVPAHLTSSTLVHYDYDFDPVE